MNAPSTVLGYGNYGMRDEDLFAAIPRLARMGYRAIEITTADGWPTAPARLDAGARRRLRDLLHEQGFAPPVVMELINPFAPENLLSPEAVAAFDTRFRASCRLAADLGATLLTFTLGSHLPPWDTGRDQLAGRVAVLAAIAREHGITLALEPHAGGSFDRPEKALWLLDRLHAEGHANTTLNLDVSHYLAQHLDAHEAADQLAPRSLYSHIKDVRHLPGGGFEFILPGQGGFDLARYFRQLRGHGYRGPVTVEVSGMIWRRPDYDPWAAAQACHDALSAALAASS